jgi:hypothetical protein
MPSIGAHAFSAGVLFFFGVAIAGCDELVGFSDLPPQATPAPVLSPECFADAPVAFEPKPTITLRVPFTENGGTPVSTPLEVKACKLLDHECNTLLASAVTDDTGVASIEVPTTPGTGEFRGLLRIDQPGYFKGLTIFRPPPRVDLTLPSAIAVTDRVVGVLKDVFGISTETINERGHLAIVPVTCGRAPVAGIEAVLPSDQNLADESTRVFVRNAGNLVPGESVTTPDGVVVFINLLIPSNTNERSFQVSLVDRNTRAPFAASQTVGLWRGELTTLVVAPGL